MKLESRFLIIIWMLLLCISVTPVNAEEWWNVNYSNKQNIGINDFNFSLPYLINAPPKGSCGTKDCSELKIYNGEKFIPFKFLDIDNDGYPDYVFFLSKGWEESNNFTYNKDPPFVSYNNDTLINEWKICYYKENNLFCIKRGEMNNDPDLDYHIKIANFSNDERFDLYSMVNFTSIKIDYFCPLVLDLGSWPILNLIVLTDDKFIENHTVILFKTATTSIENLKYTSGRCEDSSNEGRICYYGGSLILLGYNKSIIITKPSTGFGHPSEDYFFMTNNINESIRVYVCTNKEKDFLILPKGPNAYLIFGKPNITNLIENSLVLESPPQPIVYPSENLDAKLSIIPSINPFHLSNPYINPKIKFSSDKPILYINASWTNEYGNLTYKNLLEENGEFVLNENVLLKGCKECFPLERYEAIIYIDPPFLLKENSILISLENDNNYVGYANFSYDKLKLVIEANPSVQYLYFLHLLIFIVISILSFFVIKNMRKESLQSSSLINRFLIFVVLVGLFVSAINNHLWSYGSIPFVFLLLIVLFFFVKKIIKLRNN